MPRPTANQKAFTLIEVLMAATVLVVSFTAVIQAVTMGADLIDTARKQQIAEQIIEGEIAYLRTAPWVQIGSEYGVSDMLNRPFGIRIDDTGTSAISIASPPYDVDHFSLDDNPALMAAAKGFTCQENATKLRPSSGPATATFLSITYTVTWTGYNGRTHTRTGVACFGQNGLHLSYQK